MVEEYVDSIPAEVAATTVLFEPKAKGPTVEVMSQGAEGEHPGADVLKAFPVIAIALPIEVQPLGITAST